VAPTDPPVSTFEHHLDLLDLGRVAERDQVLNAIRQLDERVNTVDGVGFGATPFRRHDALAAAVGLTDGVELWVKDETGNVSGSHKARHLFGVAVREALAPSGDGSWAIASCGNAALGASVIAAAARHDLDVFVPEWADDGVVATMADLGAAVNRVARQESELGDPAYHAMVGAIAAGATAFSCQGSDTPAAIDGGRTLAFEMVETLAAHDHPTPPRLDRLFVQVGGGALGTAVVTGLARSDLPRLPVVHAVQPAGNHPLVVAWDTIAEELLGRVPEPTIAGRLAAAAEIGPVADDTCRGLVQRMQAEPRRYMRPWPTEPSSYATGILDDVTYDWIPLIEAMLRTAGAPVVPSEDDFRAAHRVGHETTAIPVCPTGASGLGGLMALHTAVPGHIGSGERVAVLFTGRQRAGDPTPR